MRIDSRLRKLEKGMTYREKALLWLKTLQAKGGYSDYWKFAEFEPWAAENEEAGLLYQLTSMVNGTVLLAAQQWRALAKWGSLLSLSMLDVKPGSKPFEPQRAADFYENWRNALCGLLAEVVALQHAVDLISAGYFDGHDVLFSDAKQQLCSSFERAKLLIQSYNCFAEEVGKDLIDMEAVGNSLGRRVEQHLDEWVMLSRSKALAAADRLFEARDQVLAFLASEKAAENGPTE